MPEPSDYGVDLALATTDFLGRLQQAQSDLDRLAETTTDNRNRWRLKGKAEGVRLAMSYWRDAERFHADAERDRKDQGLTGASAGAVEPGDKS